MGRFDLGLGEREFWSLTPRKFDLLVKRKLERDKDADRRTATICTVIANCHRDPKQPPLQVEDFMPAYPGSERRKKMTAEQMFQVVRALNVIFHGEEPNEP